jgi:hypothetical protein
MSFEEFKKARWAFPYDERKSKSGWVMRMKLSDRIFNYTLLRIYRIKDV